VRVDEPVAPSASAPPTLLERAAAGDYKKQDTLNERAPSDRSAEETIALHTGRSKNKSLALEGFAAEIQKKADLLKEKEQLERLKDFFYDRETTNQAASVIVALPGNFAADLLYELWTGKKGRDESTILAEELVYSKDVRENASAELKTALDLRDVEECEQAKQLVQAANDHGDRRSVHLLAKFNNKWGCGPKKRDDCWECLRKLDDEKGAATIIDAIRSANKRAAPRL
jgi:hypothetical protein